MKRSVCGFALVLVVATGCQSSRFLAALRNEKPRYSNDDFWAEENRRTDRRNDRSRDRDPGANLRVARLIKRAKADFANENLQSARRGFQDVLALDPDNATAHHQLAMIADLQKDFRTAERHYRAALRKEPRNPHLHCNLGYSCYLQNRYAESERHLRDALKINPRHERALYNLGALYAAQGDNQLAFEQFRRAGATKREADGLIAKMSNTRNSGNVRYAGATAAARDDDRYLAPPPNSGRGTTLRDQNELQRRMELARRRGEMQRRTRSGNRGDAMGPRQPLDYDRRSRDDGDRDSRRYATNSPRSRDWDIDIRPGAVQPPLRNRDDRYDDSRGENSRSDNAVGPQRPRFGDPVDDREDYRPRTLDGTSSSGRGDSTKADPLLWPPPRDTARSRSYRSNADQYDDRDSRSASGGRGETAYLPEPDDPKITELDRRAMRMAENVGNDRMFPQPPGGVTHAGGSDRERTGRARNAVYHGDRDAGNRSADYQESDYRRDTSRRREPGRYTEFRRPSRTSRTSSRDSDDRYSPRRDEAGSEPLPDPVIRPGR